MRREHRSSRVFWPRLYKELCGRLVAAREHAGLTQREAAAKLGRSHSFVAKSEAGERRVDVVELIQFAKAYGRSVNYFLPGTGEAQ
jgi:transcriptional regulator with XRE-family HTH domain